MANRTGTSRQPAGSTAVDRLKSDPDLNDPDATQTLAEVDTTQPLDQRGNGQPPALRRDLDTMVAANVSNNLRTLAGMVEFRHAETTRRTRLDADMDALSDLTALAAEGFTHARDVGHVPDELKRRVLALARGWAPDGDGAS